jgi:endonuclease/exonuclease/phosphatase family metal-dependent hydrolase
MKRIGGICFFGVVMLFLGVCRAQEGQASGHIHSLSAQAAAVDVMTFNIRASNILEGLNKWCFRKKVIFDVLTDSDADVIGLQEAQYSQLKDIREVLPHYDSYAAGRSDGKQRGESCPIFYRKDRFTLLDSGTFWFSDTPAVSGSKDWGNIAPRICSWVHLYDKRQNTGFYVYNVHLASTSQKSREKSVRLLAQRIAERSSRDAFIVTGDFNMELDNPAMMYLMKDGYETPYPPMTDAWRSVNPGRAEASTCRAAGGLIRGPHLDHIQLCEYTKALGVTIDERKLKNNYASDHFPVIAKLLIPNASQIAQLDKMKDNETF